MLYVTHDQKEALSMADRLAVMSMGRVEQIGRPRQVYRRPRDRFVANFIGEANLIPGRLGAVEGRGGQVRTELGEFQARLGPTVPEVGAEVECMVRPECLRVGEDADNTFRARLMSSVYLGEVEQYVLQAGEQALRAVVANPGEEAPEPGADVTVGFAASDAVLLPPEGGEEGSA
jgi:ABC-type Fe3+/spermidine/putrescine transport system ATPase subunit